MKVLDVGCGLNPRGSVNIDSMVKGSMIGKKHIVSNFKGIKNFVVADACHLPFRENCFEKLISFHSLEHIPDESLALSEFKRVTNNVIEIHVPYVWFENIINRVCFWKNRGPWRKRHHLRDYSKKSFEESLLKHFTRDQVELRYGFIDFICGLFFIYRVDPIIPFPFPAELVAKILLVKP